MHKTILLITHEQTSATDTGIVGRILREAEHTVITHAMFRKGADGALKVDVNFPPLEGIDAVIAFGSFSHIYGITEDWLRSEIDYVAEIHSRGIPYMGICFGAQLLAEGLGGRTVPSARIEVGLITFDAGFSCPISSGPWFSWHSDKVELPDGVEILAKTAIAPQVFRQGRSIGLQFHPEVNLELLREWVRIGGSELDGVLNHGQLLKDWADNEDQVHQNTRVILDWFLVGADAPTPVG
ncbi:hypothetical protein CVV68_09425 [Arthrobacter livingstonensis]|uniref:Glutamine amidotransferase domain-containing protein n=1 Tax=Arthrobacter livingstonensis TaxID=670078 RepID=A0A2V5LVP7_9MICC|nr:type 1 glutamine amidotransferase [Arthrobacter livingstonensis]PYI67647.1 hypothetical protein CVV68_09425 [Arthrobacter livingstonensis]